VIPQQQTLFHRIKPARASIAKQVEQQAVIAIQRFTQAIQRTFAELELRTNEQERETVSGGYACDAAGFGSGTQQKRAGVAKPVNQHPCTQREN